MFLRCRIFSIYHFWLQRGFFQMVCVSSIFLPPPSPSRLSLLVFCLRRLTGRPEGSRTPTTCRYSLNGDHSQTRTTLRSSILQQILRPALISHHLLYFFTKSCGFFSLLPFCWIGDSTRGRAFTCTSCRAHSGNIIRVDLSIHSLCLNHFHFGFVAFSKRKSLSWGAGQVQRQCLCFFKFPLTSLCWSAGFAALPVFLLLLFFCSFAACHRSISTLVSPHLLHVMLPFTFRVWF